MKLVIMVECDVIGNLVLNYMSLLFVDLNCLIDHTIKVEESHSSRLSSLLVKIKMHLKRFVNYLSSFADNDGRLTGNDAVKFFSLSQLPRAELKQVLLKF